MRCSIIHMNGRVYEPSLGRMLSPGPVTQAPENGQNYNRYSYVYNNPLKYTDPSGYRGTNRKSQCADGCYGAYQSPVGFLGGGYLTDDGVGVSGGTPGGLPNGSIIGNQGALAFAGAAGGWVPVSMPGDSAVKVDEPIDEDDVLRPGECRAIILPLFADVGPFTQTWPKYCQAENCLGKKPLALSDCLIRSGCIDDVQTLDSELYQIWEANQPSNLSQEPAKVSARETVEQ